MNLFLLLHTQNIAVGDWIHLIHAFCLQKPKWTEKLYELHAWVRDNIKWSEIMHTLNEKKN